MVLFRSLSREDIHKIIEIEIGKVFKRIKDLGYSLELTEVAKDFVAERGFDEKFGARPLKRAIQKYIEDPIAEEIINNRLEEGDILKIDFDKAGDSIKVQVVKQKPKKTKPAKENGEDEQ
jgi:ATP-dependent Clp protease ATP-binding subunit ClpC